MNDRSSPDIGRRDLLRVLAIGAAAGATASCGSASTQVQEEERDSKPRYRETADVKSFYRVNSYPP